MQRLEVDAMEARTSFDPLSVACPSCGAKVDEPCRNYRGVPKQTCPQRRPRFRSRPPRGWRVGHDGSLACPHRDVSCCSTCASAQEVVEVLGAHFWMSTAAEKAQMLARLAEAEKSLAAQRTRTPQADLFAQATPTTPPK